VIEPRPLPDPEDRCRGQCGGSGTYLAEFGRWLGPAERDAWQIAEARAPSRDGWQRLECPACGGTGRRR
jgi:hypothetical protein